MRRTDLEEEFAAGAFVSYLNYDFRREVLAGIEWLTKVLPDGWVNLIDLGRFRMESVNDCIFGQLFGSEVYDGILAEPRGSTWIASHGFSVYAEDTWREEIEKRL